MSGTESSGGRSSQGFFRWLKNTWLGKLWNWIVSWFRPEQEETGPGSASEKQGNAVDDNNDQSKYHEVGQDKVSESRQTSVNSESLTMSRSSSEPSLNSTSLSESPINSKDELQSHIAVSDVSQSDNQTDTGAADLEWEGEYNSDVTSLQETSPQPGQRLDNNDTKGENGNGQNTRKKGSDSETKSTSRNNKAESQSKQEERRKEVLSKKKEIDKEDENQREKKSKEIDIKQDEAKKRKQQEIDKKKPSEKKKQKRSVSCDHSAQDGSSPNSNLSRSSSSSSSLSSQRH
ncbi:MAG: hypothetical protein sL5_06730 [Candidatus Mesenet longicola]|uniref:Uncharacterized protein n=1 Tax=Candidatus Mesenet longicola TaxID=1892558 RepID=A0A8J3HVI0_9RICK|nr:MAG: hypothetical protein sGL2_04380 [Candidatus Mesenet longicola]GHM59680.1 MAG: hypothetical protein sL5_06730 [Candidatus Mesenet longicola]